MQRRHNSPAGLPWQNGERQGAMHLKWLTCVSHCDALQGCSQFFLGNLFGRASSLSSLQCWHQSSLEVMLLLALSKVSRPARDFIFQKKESRKGKECAATDFAFMTDIENWRPIMACNLVKAYLHIKMD